MRRFLAVSTVAVAGLVAAGVSNAGRSPITLTCTGLGTLTVTVTQTTNDHSVAWGVGTVSPGFHGIPVGFTVTVTDLTTGTVLDSFTQEKGGGNGMHNLPTVTCTEEPETATAGELGIPGVNPTDVIQFTFSAQVVIHQ